MRRFELVEGSSRKFWEIEVAGSDLTVAYGRIGTAGLRKTKALASAAAAAVEAARLIKEKVGKGYQEFGQPQTAVAATAPVAGNASAPGASASSELAWPSGGFAWDSRMREALPDVRGIRVRPFQPDQAVLAAPPVFAAEPHLQEWLTHFASRLADAGQPVPGLPPGAAAADLHPWDPDDAAGSITAQAMQHAAPAEWDGLLLQCSARALGWPQHHLIWYTHFCLNLRGAPFLLERLIALAPALLNPRAAWYLGKTLLPLLRQALAAADAEAHAAAQATAAAARGRDPLLDAALSHLFPEIAEWAEDSVKRQVPLEFSYWLNQSVMSIELALQHFKRQQFFRHQMAQVALQLHLHGEAAMPLLELWADHAADRESARFAFKLLGRMRIPRQIDALLERLGHKEARPVLEEIVEAWPAATLYAAFKRATAAPSPDVEELLARMAAMQPGLAAAVLAACGSAERERFGHLLQTSGGAAEAPYDALPGVLRNPPWQRPLRPQPIPALALAPLPVPAAIDWPDGMLAAWRRHSPPEWIRRQWQKNPGKHSFETALLIDLHIRQSACERVLAGEPLQPDDIQEGRRHRFVDYLLWLPDAAALSVWNAMPGSAWADWSLRDGAQALLARFELAALPGLLNLLAAKPEIGLPLALPFDASGIAAGAAHALLSLKKAKAAAIAWLRRHPQTALLDLLPAAFGPDRKARDSARFAVRWLVNQGHAGLAEEAAARYGEAMRAALAALLAEDPLLNLPAKLPKLPGFFVPGTVHRPMLARGGALPAAAVEALGTMLANSSLEAPYAGVGVVKAACTGESLAEFAWDVFEAWIGAGSPAKENWAFTALGLLGNDETARRLAAKIRQWPGEAAHARAVAGLDLLAAIGSDVALMHLNGIASKVKFKALQDRAKEKIAAVADIRGFTPEELADRLVPDLGLDDTGSALLDFGPRRFHVGFDEALKPFVKDEAGSRLKDLPKPNRSDDITLAGTAVERYAALKKDAKAVASLQVVRLELAMCNRRRWTPENFRLFFLEHPLSRHLARRLVWGVYRDGRLAEAFRVAEDLTLADRHDNFYRLPDDVELGIAHALEMPADLAADFGQMFADYEILQPFKQLGRETHAPTADELKAQAITRFKDKKVATGSVMGLTNRGWERGDAQDGGWIGEFVKPLPGELEVALSIEPGTYAGDVATEPEQRIPEILIRKPGTWGKEGLVDFARVDPILVSEMIRDADLLAPL